jgi:ABC-2 type transport system permease protein
MSTLVRLTLRRDRIVLPVCMVIAAGFVILTASSFQGLYPTLADRLHFAATIRDTQIYEVLYGPAIGLDTIGGLTAWRTGGSLAAVVGLINLLLVGRHTRAEEERGRTELIRAGAIGPRTPLAAALAAVAMFDVAVALVIGLGLTALGLPFDGSFLLGASLAAVGLVFASVAAVTAQVTEGVRAANGLAAGVLAASYALRAAGDAGDGTLSWLSPIGWGRETHAFAGDRWWPLLLCLVTAAALTGLAFRLLSRRDLGAGLLRSRPGPPAGSLRDELALAFRLQRGGLLAWTAGMFLCGVVIGSVGTSAGDLIETSQGVADVLQRSGGDIVDAFFASVFVLLALMGSGYTISSGLRLRAEETAGHAELLLSTPVARLRWAGGHLLMAMAGSAAVLLATGLGAGIAYAVGSHDAGQIPRLTGAALAELPAVWVLGAVVAALFGLLPRAASLAWAALGACVVIWLLGPLLDVPGWVLDVSPFQHVPAVPSAALHAGPLLALIAVAAALTAAGLVAFRRRDLT